MAEYWTDRERGLSGTILYFQHPGRLGRRAPRSASSSATKLTAADIRGPEPASTSVGVRYTGGSRPCRVRAPPKQAAVEADSPKFAAPIRGPPSSRSWPTAQSESSRSWRPDKPPANRPANTTEATPISQRPCPSRSARSSPARLPGLHDMFDGRAASPPASRVTICGANGLPISATKEIRPRRYHRCRRGGAQRRRREVASSATGRPRLIGRPPSEITARRRSCARSRSAVAAACS